MFFFYFFGKFVYKKLGSRGTLQCSSNVCKSENGWPSHLSILMSMAYNTKPHSNNFTLQPNLSTFHPSSIQPPFLLPQPTQQATSFHFLALKLPGFFGIPSTQRCRLAHQGAHRPWQLRRFRGPWRPGSIHAAAAAAD